MRITQLCIKIAIICFFAFVLVILFLNISILNIPSRNLQPNPRDVVLAVSKIKEGTENISFIKTNLILRRSKQYLNALVENQKKQYIILTSSSYLSYFVLPYVVVWASRGVLIGVFGYCVAHAVSKIGYFGLNSM